MFVSFYSNTIGATRGAGTAYQIPVFTPYLSGVPVAQPF